MHLARRPGHTGFSGPAWWTDDPRTLVAVLSRLFTAAHEIASGPGAARLHRKFGKPLDYDMAFVVAAGLRGIVETHPRERAWLALGRVSSADIACYPYLALAWEGGIELEQYPAMRNGFTRIRNLPGYVAMPGM